MKKLLLGTLMLASVGAFAQTKKVIIEDYTGVKCGYCPDGAKRIEAIHASNPTNAISIAIHTGSYTHPQSPLRTLEGDAINSAVTIPGYPAGAVDRVKYPPAYDATNGWTGIAMSRGQWANAFNARAANNAIVSVSFSNVKRLNATDYEMDVNVEFTSAPTSGVPLALQVYVLEDGISAKQWSSSGATDDLRQTNYSAAIEGGASPLQNWFHNDVLRKALGGAWGFTTLIPATPVVNTVYTQKVTFSSVTGASPVGWANENLKVVAFVAYNGSAANDQKEILNAEEYSLKGLHPTNVNTVTKNVEIMSAYPNPASTNDVIRVQYSIAKSETVTMRVLNLMGQEVAVPYVSNEVSGGHTIQWKASDYSLAPGVYFMEVSTASGKNVQRISIN